MTLAYQNLDSLLPTDKPTPPQGPVEIIESAVTSVEFKWKPPKDNGGCPVTNYILERQQVGRNKWSNLGEIPCSTSYKDTDVDPGRRYCYRIRAKNAEGISDYLQTGDIPAGVLRKSLTSRICICIKVWYIVAKSPRYSVFLC